MLVHALQDCHSFPARICLLATNEHLQGMQHSWLLKRLDKMLDWPATQLLHAAQTELTSR